MRRKQFLREFLGALRAKETQWQMETDTSISGTVIYEIDDPEEVQDALNSRTVQPHTQSAVLLFHILIETAESAW